MGSGFIQIPSLNITSVFKFHFSLFSIGWDEILCPENSSDLGENVGNVNDSADENAEHIRVDEATRMW